MANKVILTGKIKSQLTKFGSGDASGCSFTIEVDKLTFSQNGWNNNPIQFTIAYKGKEKSVDSFMSRAQTDSTVFVDGSLAYKGDNTVFIEATKAPEVLNFWQKKEQGQQQQNYQQNNGGF